MARCFLIAFLYAPMSVMGGGEALAAEAAEPVEEDIEQVYGRDEDTISIATGYRKPLDLAPSVATVITEDDIQAIGATTLSQVIETVAGIHVSTTNAVDSVVTVRGITSRVLVLLNNVPVAQGLFVNAFAQLDNIQINVGVSRALDPDGTADFELTNTDLTYHGRYSSALDLTAQVSYVNVHSNFEVTGFPPGAFGGAFPDGVRQDLGLDEDRARAELTALWTGLEQHWLRAGLGGVFESSDTTEDVRNYTVRQGFPVPTGRFAERGGIDDVPIFPDEDRTIFFAYLQDEWDFAPDWSLTTGVRIDEYSDFGTTVNPRVGFVWNTAYRLTTKLLYGRAFRPPSFAERHSNGLFLGLGDPDLEPVTIDMVELAFNYRATRWRSNLSFFGYSIEDLIELVPDPASPNGLGFINGGGQDGYGLEWELGFDITSKLGLSGSYAYQDATVDDNNVNVRFAPKHQIYAEANWRFAPQWNLNLNVKSIFDRDRPAGDPRPPAGDYSLLNLTLRREGVGKHLDVAFSVRNLLDEEAREPSDSPAAIPFDIPLAGRNFYGELRVRF